ncbi:MAG: hypothetical protein QG564_1180, partial [Campylobacterota bacterium]|nr:hypothetical protein [Campylobacterota bacterium]
MKILYKINLKQEKQTQRTYFNVSKPKKTKKNTKKIKNPLTRILSGAIIRVHKHRDLNRV